MKKRCREDVEDQMRLFINSFRLATGSRPQRVTVTSEDYVLLWKKDPATREVVKPLVFDTVPIHVLG